MRRATVSALVLCSLALTGCSRQGPPPAAGVPEVGTLTVCRQSVLLTTDLPGRTAPFLIAEIRPQVSGLLQKRLFTEGGDVAVGQLLYQIDPAPFQAALDNALAGQAKAEAALPALQSRTERYHLALAEKAVSQQDYDDAAGALKQAQAAIVAARAEVETARINLAYTSMTSPIHGRIGKSSVTDGAIVTAYQGMALATIQQLDPIYVDVPQSTSQLLELKQRLECQDLTQSGTNVNAVELLLENGARYPLEGTLQFRDVTVDPTTGSVILRMIFPNPRGLLLPGMYVRALVKEGINDHAILVPQQAVSRDTKGNPTVLVVGADSTLQQRGLELERALGSQWLVSAGLAPGDKIVTEGLQRVRSGMLVKEAVPAAKTNSLARAAAPAAADVRTN